MNKYLSISLIICAMIIGVGLGYVMTPEYGRSLREGEFHAADLGKPDRYVDLRFMNGLVAHHKSAIFMLEQVKLSASHPELKGLADLVIPADTAEIKQLMIWRKDWFGRRGEINRFNRTQLGTADDKFDLRFLNAIIAHHNEAIATMKEIQTKSSREEIVKLANEAETRLTDNVTMFKAWRKAWYNIE